MSVPNRGSSTGFGCIVALAALMGCAPSIKTDQPSAAGRAVHFCPAPNVSTKCQGLSDGHLKTDSIEKGITETPMGNLPLSDSYYHVTFNDGRAIFRPPSLSLTARISTRLRQTANVAAIRELACRPNRLRQRVGASLTV